MKIDNLDIIFKILINKKTKVTSTKRMTKFSLSNLSIKCHKILGDKIIKFVDDRKYNYLRNLIDMYKEKIEINF